MRNLKFLGVSFLLAMTAATSGVAQNPIIQTKYTADPAPMVYNDTVFLYTTHDEDDAEGFKMLDWLLYTSTDMVNWTDHGAVASLKSFDWVKRDNGAWAEQVIERNGKFYMYCPIHGNGIGVLVSDSPYGPFKDPLNKPLVWQKEHWYDIDPTVFIDDDGQAYMYWGNPNVYYVKLNEDMVSIKKNTLTVLTPKGGSLKDYAFREAAYVFYRNGLYYFMWSVDDTGSPNYHVAYGTSKSPLGPIKVAKKPVVLIQDPAKEIYGPAHNAVLQIPGTDEWYIVYHRINKNFIDREKGPGVHREVCIDRMEFNPDGTIRKVVPTL